MHSYPSAPSGLTADRTTIALLMFKRRLCRHKVGYIITAVFMTMAFVVLLP